MNQETSSKTFQIKEIDLNSPHFETVVQLHGVGKARLGPFPRGAFEDHAARRMILAAVTVDDAVAGYLLFRIAKNRAVIVHLTTSEAFRKKGIARLLTNSLKDRKGNMNTICPFKADSIRI